MSLQSSRQCCNKTHQLQDGSRKIQIEIRNKYRIYRTVKTTRSGSHFGCLYKNKFYSQYTVLVFNTITIFYRASEFEEPWGMPRMLLEAHSTHPWTCYGCSCLWPFGAAHFWQSSIIPTSFIPVKLTASQRWPLWDDSLIKLLRKTCLPF